MKDRIFIADASGVRLDIFLARQFDNFSRSVIQKLIVQGFVSVDGKPLSSDIKLKEGQKVSIRFPQPEWLDKEPFESWILHEDKDLIVFNKPAGLLMHPMGPAWLSEPEASGFDLDPNLAGLILRRRKLEEGVERCGLVHRLDRQTSGVLVVAKTLRAQKALLEDFKERRIEKTYMAIVRGSMEKARTNVDAPIGRSTGRRRIAVTPYGRPAETEMRVVKKTGQATLVEAKPKTGRTHQIRAHLAVIGHPVCGDTEFDLTPSNNRPPRLMLHAFRLAFTHPGSKRRREFKASIPADFKTFWTQISGS